MLLLVISVSIASLALFLELARRAPVMEVTDHGLVYVGRSPKRPGARRREAAPSGVV
jgi:hypothetical protein